VWLGVGSLCFSRSDLLVFGGIVSVHPCLSLELLASSGALVPVGLMIKMFLWWHFQFGWTRTNQEVSQYIRGFSCFSRLTGMAPAQDMTRNLLDGSRKGGL
jgi:hypothetical protein